MDVLASLRRNGDLDPQEALSDAFYRTTADRRGHPADGFDAQETIALLRHQAHVVGRDVLDLGVGTGRTARVLARLARRYYAIDYAPGVVARLRAAMPAVEVHLEDMRDLARWDDGSIDFVFGPGNVLDLLSHAGRERALVEAHRVLRAGGLLVFSSHNRCYVGAKAGPRLGRSRNPLTAALHVARYLATLRLHRRMRPLLRTEDDYALIDDCGPRRALLHYHVDRTAQERQLARTGFELVEVIDGEGAAVPKGEMAPGSSRLMYVARKAA